MNILTVLKMQLTYIQIGKRTSDYYTAQKDAIQIYSWSQRAQSLPLNDSGIWCHIPQDHHLSKFSSIQTGKQCMGLQYWHCVTITSLICTDIKFKQAKEEGVSTVHVGPTIFSNSNCGTCTYTYRNPTRSERFLHHLHSNSFPCLLYP